ncbi:MAG TPA: LysM peptidoglycan-binding domain-containing protein [Kineosporiaceae bacterium]|nr:LysM peptidoglycan-binding domain-containing protein [Kineosporiaceae bacterium]
MATTTVRTSATGTAAGAASPNAPGVGRPRLRVIDGGRRGGCARAVHPDGAGARRPAGVRTAAVGVGVVGGGAARGVGRDLRVCGLSAVGEATAGIAAPGRLRLTRRGRLVVRAGVVLLAMLVALLAVLLLSRPAVAGAGAEPVPVRYHVVLPGETLWGIAGEAAPQGDRREVIAQIIELNALPSAGVVAGQRIALP